MRVALCLSGIVGRLYTNKGNYKWEKDVDFRIGHYHYKKHIFDVNENVDVFIHSWDTKYEDEIVNTYNPKKYKFQEQIVFNENDVRQHFIESRWFGAKQVNNLKSEYERENDFTYDVVMWSRFDVGFFTDLVFSELEEFDSLYIPKSNPPNMNQPTVLDYWYFSSSKNMDIVSDFHSHWKDYGCRSAHHDLYQWPTDNDIDVIMLSKFEESEKGNGNTDIIRAVYDNCEYQGKDFSGVESIRKLDRYPRGHRF
jgi:hypothetical protein|tara:strand:- start:405 stop:1163 length:759 start_codon:yes stop_codon:yes gene_type:complete